MKKLLLICSIITCSILAQAQESSTYIRLNQTGFLPFAEKLAVIVETDATSFEIVDTLGNVVFSENLGKSGIWSAAGEEAKIADFTILTNPGIYQVKVNGYGESFRFEISDTVFTEINNAIVKAFYFNRASTELLEENAGIYARPFGHPDTTVIVLPSAAGPTRIAGDTLSCPKGWYDAGDYNKYIVNSGISTATLLLAYENYSAYYDTLTWNIPESGNATADILDEIRWNLDWMLTQQDPADGGVYNKTTSANFSGSVMPTSDKAKRYVVAKGTAATLDFAAVMAIASRVYEPIDATFADSCLAAAELAWDWAAINSAIMYSNPASEDGYPAVGTDGYGDWTLTDEFIWAATELFISTNNETKYAASINISGTFEIPGWRNVKGMSLLSLYTHRNAVGYAIDTAVVKGKIVDKASSIQSFQANSNAFRVPITNFTWGSNGALSNEGIFLLYAYNITTDLSYFNAALSAYDYILGRNATEYSFVTGYGEYASKNVHHRPSEADGISGSIPGFLAGGAYSGANDIGDCSGEYPAQSAKSYKDAICSYSTNEIAINWQAPMTYMSHGIVAEYKHWLTTLPEFYAFPSTKNIPFKRTQESANFSVMANTEWHILTNDTWYSFSEDTTVGSGFVTMNITEFNDGDSIRNGAFYIVIANDTIDSMQVSQIGKLSNFRVEAEDYIAMSGVQTETTSDIGGGANVGWIDDGDSMTFTLDISHTGSYQIDYRVASQNESGEFYLEMNDSAYSLIYTSPTGDWQNWEDFSDTAYFEEGIHEITLVVYQGGFNLNYFDFTYLGEDNIAPVHTPTIPDVPNNLRGLASRNISIENPIEGNTISIFGLEDGRNYDCFIFSIEGQILDKIVITSTHNQIPMYHPSGKYICSIVSKDNSYKSFVVVKK